MNWICKHKWEKIEESIVNKDIYGENDFRCNRQNVKIVLLSCTKCGKLKRVDMK